MVQTPVATMDGRFVVVATPTTAPPICCTVQAWVEGEPPHGDFSAAQARQLGTVLAKLHVYSRHYDLSAHPAAHYQDGAALLESALTLRAALPETILTADGYATVMAAQRRIAALMAELGTAASVWGPVHGDLHYDNVLLNGDEIRPIDFGGLRVAHYLYDLGVTLYHIHYQGAEIRRALLEGYQQLSPLPDAYPHLLEAFVTYAALDNLAWNSTIPEQAGSALFQRNLRQFIEFCAAVAEDRRYLTL
jgi:Ser/Thr protein kinase RdoA (MazF antagonist)